MKTIERDHNNIQNSQELSLREINNISRREFIKLVSTIGGVGYFNYFLVACKAKTIEPVLGLQTATPSPSTFPSITPALTNTMKPAITESPSPTLTPEPTSTLELVKGITVKIDKGSEYWEEAKALEKSLREKEFYRLYANSVLKEDVNSRSIVINNFPAINTSGEIVDVIASVDQKTGSYIVPHFKNLGKKSGIDGWIIAYQMPRLGEQILLLEDDYTVPSPYRPYLLNRGREPFTNLVAGFKNPEGEITGRILSWRSTNRIIRDNLSWKAAWTLVRMGRPDRTSAVEFPAVDPIADITPEYVNSWVDKLIQRSPIFSVDGLITNGQKDILLRTLEKIKELPEDQLKVLMSITRNFKLNVATGGFSHAKPGGRELILSLATINDGVNSTLVTFFHEATHMLQQGSPSDHEFVAYVFDLIVGMEIGASYESDIPQLVNSTYPTSITGP